jgi:hypothetical protein
VRHLIAICLLLVIQPLAAQQPTVKQLRETALNFQRQEDYGNALMILSRALEMEPLNLSLLKDIANTLYLAGDYKQAGSRALPLTARADADEQVFQIAGDIFTIQEDWKQADKIYRKGLKKFPVSGPLFSKFGEMFWLREKPADAIAQWENGLKADPTYPLNYYHAAKFYFTTADKARSIIYGEIFVNQESYTARTAEIKVLLLESYKRVYMTGDSKKFFVKETTPFESKVLSILNKQTEWALRGITPDNLLAIRTRFITDWYEDEASVRFPFQLFEHQRNLLKEGLFEAYNQWIFGTAADPNAYQFWTKTHEGEQARYSLYQRNKLFKMPAGQYYF